MTLLLFLIAPLLVAAAGRQEQQPTCEAAALTNEEVKAIVDNERAKRTDLPVTFPQYTWEVRRRRCHYVYIEYGLPRAPDYSQSITLNQRGVIVDASPGGNIKCPEKVFKKEELFAFVSTERVKKKDVPVALSNSETRVERLRCMYLYFEYGLPRESGNYQVFTIDPYGELMSVYRSKPEQ
jgi:hypothetical protein